MIWRICESLWWSKQSWCSGRTLRRCWGVSTLSPSLHILCCHFTSFPSSRLFNSSERNFYATVKLLLDCSPEGGLRALIWIYLKIRRCLSEVVRPVCLELLFGREGKLTFAWGVGSGMLLLGVSESFSLHLWWQSHLIVIICSASHCSLLKANSVTHGTCFAWSPYLGLQRLDFLTQHSSLAGFFQRYFLQTWTVL